MNDQTKPTRPKVRTRKRNGSNGKPAPQEKSLDTPLDIELTTDASSIFKFEPVLGRDVKVGRFLICQPTSSFPGANKNIGSWYNTVTGDYREVIEFLILSIARPRVMFSEPFERGAPSLCRSLDSLTPLPEFVGHEREGVIIPDECVKCPFSAWIEPLKEGDRRLPPRCSETFLYFGVDVDTGLPFSVRLKGTALASARGLNTLVERNVLSLTYKSQLYEQQGGAHKYYVPVIGPGRATAELPSELRVRALRVMGALQGKPLWENEDSEFTE